MRTGDGQLIRDMNRSLVLNLVRDSGAISRADLSRVSGLSPSTVTAITEALLADGYLLEEGPTQPARGRSRAIGRPPILLRVDAAAGQVVGIKVSATNLTAIVTDLAATPLAFVELPRTPASTPEAVATLFASAVDAVCSKAGVGVRSLLGVGVGLPGVVAPSSGRVRMSPLKEWASFDLVEILGDRLQLPVHLDNDVNTLTIAEQLFGAGRGLQHFLVVTIGRGIGMGAVVNGSIYRGATGSAGELGHITVAPDGPACWCGRRGCLEAMAAEPALVHAVLAATGRLLQPEEIAGAASRDPRIARLLEQAGSHVGRAIANVVTILDSQRVIVSGEGVRLGDIYVGALHEAAEGRLQTKEGPIELIVESWGDETWARGAATLVLRDLFHPAHLRDAAQASAVPVRTNENGMPARAGRGG